MERPDNVIFNYLFNYWKYSYSILVKKQIVQVNNSYYKLTTWFIQENTSEKLYKAKKL